MRTRLKTSHVVEIDPSNDYQGLVRDFFPEIDVSWGDGTDANEADRYYCDTRTPGAATAEDLDLTALTPGPRGSTVTLAEVKIFAIYCPSSNDSPIELKSGATNGWTNWHGGNTDPVKIRPGTTSYLIVNGSDGQYAVAAGNKVVNVNNPGGAGNTYTVLLVGPSA